MKPDRPPYSAIRSADPENPTLEPNMKCIRSPVAEIWPFAYLGDIWNPQFGGRGSRRGQRWHHSKEQWRFHRLSIVTVALSVTIQPQFAIECLRRSNQQGWALWAKISGCSPWNRPLMFGSAESEHPRVTNLEIILEELHFQPRPYMITIHQRYRRTDRQTDDMRSQDRALR